MEWREKRPPMNRPRPLPKRLCAIPILSTARRMPRNCSVPPRPGVDSARRSRSRPSPPTCLACGRGRSERRARREESWSPKDWQVRLRWAGLSPRRSTQRSWLWFRLCPAMTTTGRRPSASSFLRTQCCGTSCVTAFPPGLASIWAVP